MHTELGIPSEPSIVQSILIAFSKPKTETKLTEEEKRKIRLEKLPSLLKAHQPS